MPRRGGLALSRGRPKPENENHKKTWRGKKLKQLRETMTRCNTEKISMAVHAAMAMEHGK